MLVNYLHLIIYKEKFIFEFDYRIEVFIYCIKVPVFHVELFLILFLNLIIKYNDKNLLANKTNLLIKLIYLLYKN